MGRGRKPAKGKAKPAVSRKSRTNEDARVRDLEKRLAETLQREAEALRQLQTSHHERAEAQEQQTATAEILRVISQSPTDIQSELHGGKIWVKSEVGVGSTFTFSLPLSNS